MAQAKTKPTVTLEENDVVIRNVATIQTLGVDGDLHDMYHIQYMVREHGPFYIDVPSEGFSPADTRLRIDRRALDILTLIG